MNPARPHQCEHSWPAGKSESSFTAFSLVILTRTSSGFRTRCSQAKASGQEAEIWSGKGRPLWCGDRGNNTRPSPPSFSTPALDAGWRICSGVWLRPPTLEAHQGHEPQKACADAVASWTAVALHRFGTADDCPKRQRAGALQNLAAIRTVHGGWQSGVRHGRGDVLSGCSGLNNVSNIENCLVALAACARFGGR